MCSESTERNTLAADGVDMSWLARREPVWRAMAALWLDTELEETELRYIAAALRESGLPRATLERIYRVELAPVLGPNLLSVAGEWAGFDDAWLRARILDNLRRRPRRTAFWAWFPPTRRLWTYATDAPWRRVLEMLDDEVRTRRDGVS